MKKSIFDCNWPELARAAHWLKGAGGTVGFAEFVEPSAHLEEIAKVIQSVDQAASVYSQLLNLAAMIELPEGTPVPQTR